MKAFRVWIHRTDGASRLRVDSHENAVWLISRLSNLFVFKTSEPVREIPNSLECTFRIAFNAQLSGLRLEQLLAGITEVRLVPEPAQPAFEIN